MKNEVDNDKNNSNNEDNLQKNETTKNEETETLTLNNFHFSEERR